MDTSIPYESTGRTDQKARTRKLLVAATRQLLAKGTTPTVEQAAAASSTVGVTPLASNSRVAAMRRFRVRVFCSRRPVLSYGIDVSIMEL